MGRLTLAVLAQIVHSARLPPQLDDLKPYEDAARRAELAAAEWLRREL
ncbi:hypothetical protein AncyloWKF20_10715 [Ancylobacter sp. WKF20]|nr:hypothetical protein [Ancylobacter sp. WKF20]WGD32253.1 hypothetical protein AncyloWKF20_10715 [Ancylobacter sp. WKF20]